MKQVFRFVVAFALTLCLAHAAVLADTPISVQLDGENITFTDAEPRIVNDRTFLPLRAVFEAMGAEIGYEKGVITAVRGGRTLVMTVGSTEFTVTENDSTETFVMDVAPFIDPALSRTFVPVRFAAQAMGANVGWDADERTVIIVDTEKVVDAAFGDASFELLDKVMKLSSRYDKGIWEAVGDMSGSVTLDSYEDPVSFSISYEAAFEDAMKQQLTFDIRADLSALGEELAGEDVSEEEAAELKTLIEALAGDGVSVSVRGDLASGRLYVNPDASALGEPYASLMGGKIWFLVDYRQMLEDIGFDASVYSAAEGFDLKQLVRIIAGSMALDSAESSYAEITGMIGTLIDIFSDGAFTADGDVYTSSYEFSDDFDSLNITISVTVNDGAAVACAVEANFIESDEDYGFGMSFNGSMDDQGSVSFSASMDGDEFISLDVTADFTYTAGLNAPETEPPADAAVVDINALGMLAI